MKGKQEGVAESTDVASIKEEHKKQKEERKKIDK